MLLGLGSDPTWSPDGRAIAYWIRLPDGGDELRVLDLASMSSTPVPGSQNMYSPRWSPDGEYLAAMASDHLRLAVYSFARGTWTDVLKTPGHLEWPSWSRDSKSIYVEAEYIRDDLRGSLVRVGIADREMEPIASGKDVRFTAFYYWNAGWFGLTPDDRPITTLDTGVEEIYAFDLEYK